MANIFISYSRQSGTAVKALADDIQALGHTAWLDQELSGGQAWWDQILKTVRDCDVFVFVLDPESLNSTACKREYGYAAALGRSILPVLVTDAVSTNLLPPALSQLQYVDYRTPDRAAALSLARALTTLPPPEPLPDPLPSPPVAPVSYLGRLFEQVETTSSLSYEKQSALVVDLKRSLRDPNTIEDTRVLLARLRNRRDLFATIADAIDDLLGSTQETSSAREIPSWPPKIGSPKIGERAANQIIGLTEDTQAANLAQGCTNNVVIYMPILHLNPFFSTFLEWFCDRAQREDFNVIVKKGHNLDRELALNLDDFLENIKKSPLRRSIIVVFPPHPEAYNELLKPEKIKDFRKLNVIFMDIDPLQVQEGLDTRKQRLSEAEYIKAVIVLNNQQACEEAAKAVISCIEGQFDYVKIILCDGEYHGRAETFREVMSNLSAKAKKVDGSEGGILVEYLHSQRNIMFSSALKDSYEYVYDVLDEYLDDISECPTFIFCANDVIALGAREALDAFPREKLQRVAIIGYDGSSILEEYMKINDPYIRILLSQNYSGYTDSLVKEIKKLESKKESGDERATDKVKRIAPKIRVSSVRLRDGG